MILIGQMEDERNQNMMDSFSFNDNLNFNKFLNNTRPTEYL